MSRSPIDIIQDSIDWQEGEYDENWKPGDVPYATHTGTLKIGDIELECVQLNTGERLITRESLEKTGLGI